jgi:hypothetical protein
LKGERALGALELDGSFPKEFEWIETHLARKMRYIAIESISSIKNEKKKKKKKNTERSVFSAPPSQKNFG